MRATVLHAPGDVRVEHIEEPEITARTDAIIRLSAACVCGSDLGPYRGVDSLDEPVRMGHEYVGVVEETGSEVKNIKPGQFVVGSFATSDNTCEICRSRYQSSCINRVFQSGTQAEHALITHADGTLVATSGTPDADLVPSRLGTGWFGAAAAQAGPGKTVAVVGDGAVGLLAILAAKQLGAQRIIASRQEKLALELGATDIVTERREDGVAKVKELTGGLGAHSVVEAVGTQELMQQAGFHPSRWTRRLRRHEPGRRPQRRKPLLLPGPPERRSGLGTPVSARADRPDLAAEDRPWQGLRPHPSPRPGRRGVPGHGRAPRHQGTSHPLSAEEIS
jgi:threonine dehydrogenase-like Zn-dependent dehydrogenase